jgi:uncharacterized protein
LSFVCTLSARLASIIASSGVCIQRARRTVHPASINPNARRTLAMNELLETVGSIYAAFGCGDVPTILDALADDVAWEHWADNQAQAAGVPWLRAGRGKAAVAGFFEIVGRMQIHEFQVLGMLAGERQVAVEVLIDATPAGGSRYRDEELHLWNFDARGKVSRMRHYVDTAKHIRAAGVAASG